MKNYSKELPYLHGIEIPEAQDLFRFDMTDNLNLYWISNPMTARRLGESELRAMILEWVNGTDEFAPMEDWELIVTTSDTINLIIDLFATGNLTQGKRRVLLGCIYSFTGDSVFSGMQHTSAEVLENIHVHALGHGNEVLNQWVQRSRQLLQNPKTFNYDLWCGGGFTRETILSLGIEKKKNDAN